MFQWEDVQMRSCLKWENSSNEKSFQWKGIQMSSFSNVQMKSCSNETLSNGSCSNEKLLKREVIKMRSC